MKGWIAGLVLLATPVWAVEPSEVLDDPVLEERARDLSRGLRCLVCRNESIDESSAQLAKELRVLVRERLMMGETDGEVIDYLVARYGEFVLLEPTKGGSNLILWIAPLALLLLGGAVAGVAVTRQKAPGEMLDAAEEARLKALLGDEPRA